ncbi:MAG: hypothetical protein ACKOUS_01765, partial [Alphaproteobacteria bacterium]
IVDGHFLTGNAVFEAARPERGEDGPRIGELEERGAWCEGVAGLYGARSRRAIGQLLRQFLDRHGITTTELLHNIRFARKLEDEGMLMGAALHRMARARSEETGAPHGDCVRVLEGLLAAAWKRAVEARADRRHPVPGHDGLDALVERARHRAEDAPGRAFVARHGIARALEAEPTLLARLAMVLDWVAGASDPDALALVDELVADCLASRRISCEALGGQQDFAAALLATIDMARGREPPPPPRPATWHPGLMAFLAAHPAPDTRAVLMARARRELAGPRALARGDATAEAAALTRVAEALRDDTRGTYVGGAGAVVAMVRRWQRLDRPGGFGDMVLPEGPAARRFRALALAETEIRGEMRRRAVATLLVEALREAPVAERAQLRDLEGMIRNANLLDEAREMILRELSAAG